MALGLAAVLFAMGSLDAQPNWVSFNNETGSRLVGGSTVAANDAAEKDYIWGDVDQDGDIDLVSVRKQPFTSGGAGAFRTNVLFMNVGGVLTDQTALYAATSDVAGDNGFLTATNDRDVILADVTGDGWLDIITATTLSDGFPKHISHPRIYRNLGMVAGSWGGFIHENARMPALAPDISPGVPHAPRFCSVGAGDIDEDGDLDLYFGDYDSGGAQTLDFNDRLLLNDGNGFFSDGTIAVFSGTILVQGNLFPFQQSAFGMAVSLADMNGDGHLDIVKDTALNPPQYVGVAYNSSTSVGAFGSHKEAFPNMAPYHVSTGDLNNDGKMDIVISDDNSDSYLLNQGNDGNGMASFNRLTYAFAAGAGTDDGFASNSVIADLDLDGWNDVLIADVDVDIPPCGGGRRLHIYHNLGNPPSVTLRQENDGGAWRPIGTHDVAVFDVNGDGYPDLVIGTCSGTQVWINDPPAALAFDYPQGRPTEVGCTSTTSFQVQVIGLGSGVPAAGGLDMFASVDGGAFLPHPVSELGGDLYGVTLDGNSASSSIRYYFSASSTGGGTWSDPSTGPAANYSVVVADTLIEQIETFESGAPGWAVANGVSLTFGGWELVDPNGTAAAPESDAGVGGDVLCWVTGNGLVGGATGNSDLDGGPTTLTSPTINLAGADALISADIWFYNDEPNQTEIDQFVVEVSSNGTTWVPAMVLPGGVGTTAWIHYGFQVSNFVTPSATTRVRFIAADTPNNSIYEGGVDNFTVTLLSCGGGGPSFVRGDVNGDGSNDISDAVALLANLFGATFIIGCDDSADANDDGTLNIADAVRVLGALFGGGPPLSAPSGSCGSDPTADALDCVDTGSCP